MGKNIYLVIFWSPGSEVTASLGHLPCKALLFSAQGTKGCPRVDQGTQGTQALTITAGRRSEASGSHSGSSRALRVKVMSIGAATRGGFRMPKGKGDPSLGRGGVRVATRTVWERQNAGSSKKKANVARERRDFDLHSDMAFSLEKLPDH